MVNFKAGTLSSPSTTLSNFPLSVIKEYSTSNKLWKSAVSKAKERCFAPIGRGESVKTTLVQYDPFLFYPYFLFQRCRLFLFLEIVYR